jgi:hypothetical protein
MLGRKRCKSWSVEKGWWSRQIVKIAAVAYAYRSHVATPTPVVSVTRLDPSSVVDFLVKLAADPLSHGDELGGFEGAGRTKCPLNIGADLPGGVPVNTARRTGGQSIEQIINSSKAGLCLAAPLLLVAGAQECHTEIEPCEGPIFVVGQSLFECPTSFGKIADLIVGAAQVGPYAPAD